MKEENLIYVNFRNLDEIREIDKTVSDLMAKYKVVDQRNVYVDSYLNDAKPSLEQLMFDAKVLAMEDKQPRIICQRLWDLFPEHTGKAAIDKIDYCVESHIQIFDDFSKEDVTSYKVTSENKSGYSKIRLFLEELKILEESQVKQDSQISKGGD